MVVLATDKGIVDVGVERVLTTRGPARTTKVLLRNATVTTDLPRHLQHAAVGAEDVLADR